MSSKALVLLFLLLALGSTAQTPAPTVPRNSDQDELELHLSAADTFQISGDLANAAIENRTIIGIALQRIGNVAIEEGRFADAVKLLTESVSIADTAQARTNLAVAYQRLNDLDRALSEAEKALAIDPKFFAANYLLANIHYRRENYAEALPRLERVFRAAPDLEIGFALGVTYLSLKQPERARLLFEEIQIGAGKPSPELHLFFARAYQRTNYPAEAERELRAALSINPKFPRINFFLGYLILQLGGADRLGEAGKAFEEELKLTPNDFFTNFFAGVVASSQNEHQRAAVFLKRAVELDSRRSEAFLFLAQSQIELEDLTGAEKSLRQAISLESKGEQDVQARRTHFLLGRVLVRTGRREEGEKELAIARELQLKSIVAARDEIAQILGQVVGDPVKRAEPSPSEARIELTPQRAAELGAIRGYLQEVLSRSNHNLAVIAVQTGRADEALERFAAAAVWKADLPGLDRNWGITAFRAGRFETAAPALSRHLAANPGDALARRMLGASHYFNSEFGKAVETLKPIEQTINGDPELAYFYGISLIRIKRVREASAVFSTLAETSGTTAASLNYAAQGFMMLGDFERAVTEFRRVEVLDASMAKTNYNIGLSLIRLNRLEDAEKAFARELELNPADPFAKYHLAFTLTERRTDADRAVRLLEEAVALKPDYADARYQLGKILIERGDIQRAIEQLEAAVAADASKDYIHYQLSIAYRKASRKEDADRELKIYQELKSANRKTDTPMGSNENPPQ